MNNSKLNPSLQDKVLEVRITKLEGALLKQIRELDYGRFTISIHKIEGQPIRIEITEINKSEVLQARDGLDLEGATYVADLNKLKYMDDNGSY